MRNKRIVAGAAVLGVVLLVGLATGLTLFWQGGGASGADAASPAQTFYLEGTIYALECDCDLLDTDDSGTYRLFGDLEGFTCGDRVGVWADWCPLEECGGPTGCMGGVSVIVQDIVALPEPTPTPEPTPADPVGGIAVLPAVDERGSFAFSRIALVGLAAATTGALGVGVWLVRKRPREE
jgi:hypothetical protein